MRPKTFLITSLKLMPRPIEYMDELRAIALSISDTNMTFNLDDPRYQALKVKYRSQPNPMRARGLGDLVAKVVTEIKSCNECKYCSENQITAKVKTCCGGTKDATRYRCEKRDIFPLNVDIQYKNCPVYEKKV